MYIYYICLLVGVGEHSDWFFLLIKTIYIYIYTRFDHKQVRNNYSKYCESVKTNVVYGGILATNVIKSQRRPLNFIHTKQKRKNKIKRESRPTARRSVRGPFVDVVIIPNYYYCRDSFYFYQLTNVHQLRFKRFYVK